MLRALTLLFLIISAPPLEAYDSETIFLIGDRSSWLLDTAPDACGSIQEPVCKRTAIAIYKDSTGNKIFDFYGQYVDSLQDKHFAGIRCQLITSDDGLVYRFWTKPDHCKSVYGKGRGNFEIDRASLKEQMRIWEQSFTIGSASEFEKIKVKIEAKIRSMTPKI